MMSGQAREESLRPDMNKQQTALLGLTGEKGARGGVAL